MELKVKTVVAALALAGAATLAGCHKPEPVHTVDWFRAHPAELAKTLAACKNDPGELENSPNCKNASRADFLNDSDAGAAPLTPIK